MPTLQELHADPDSKRMLKIAADLEHRASRPIMDGDMKLVMQALAALIRTQLKRRRSDRPNVE